MVPSSPIPKPRLRKQSDQLSAPDNKLHLPRFHPAVYKSLSSTSCAAPKSTTCTTSPSSLQSQQQRQLSYYHRHLIAQYASTLHVTLGSECIRMPDTPKLMPLTGIRNLVSPLELDSSDNYFSHGSQAKDPLGVDSIIPDDAKKRSGLSLCRTATVSST